MDPKAEKRLQGRRNRQIGATAEVFARQKLAALGVNAVEHLETGWRVKRIGRKIASATPLRRVLADLVGVLPGSGRAVLVEVKYEAGNSLSLGRLEQHQRNNLDRWSNAGALVLVAWVTADFNTYLIEWPCPEWQLGEPLPINRASLLHLSARNSVIP